MRKRFTEASENDIILDAIYELTHYRVDNESKPTFFNIDELRDNYGLTIKEIVDIATRNNYNVYKFKEDEKSKPVIIVSAKEVSYDDIAKSFKEYVDINNIDEETHGSFNESVNKVKQRWYYKGPVYHFNDVITRDYEDWTMAIDKYHAYLDFNSKAKKKYGFIQKTQVRVDNNLIKLSEIEEEPKEEKSNKCERCGSLLLDDGTCPKCDRHYDFESIDKNSTTLYNNVDGFSMKKENKKLKEAETQLLSKYPNAQVLEYDENKHAFIISKEEFDEWEY